jgi:hypothetical protein
MNTKHLQTGASQVKCGAPMAPRSDAFGWTLGDVTVSFSEVTCPDCLSAPRRNHASLPGGIADGETPLGDHTYPEGG